jgi:hypothetical protein
MRTSVLIEEPYMTHATHGFFYKIPKGSSMRYVVSSLRYKFLLEEPIMTSKNIWFF